MGNYQGAAFVCGISSALTSVDCCQLAHTETHTHAQHVIGRCLLGVVSNRQLRMRNVAHSAALTKSGNWDGSSNWKWNWSRNWTWNWKWNCPVGIGGAVVVAVEHAAWSEDVSIQARAGCSTLDHGKYCHIGTLSVYGTYVFLALL